MADSTFIPIDPDFLRKEVKEVRAKRNIPEPKNYIKALFMGGPMDKQERHIPDYHMRIGYRILLNTLDAYRGMPLEEIWEHSVFYEYRDFSIDPPMGIFYFVERG